MPLTEAIKDYATKKLEPLEKLMPHDAYVCTLNWASRQPIIRQDRMCFLRKLLLILTGRLILLGLPNQICMPVLIESPLKLLKL